MKTLRSFVLALMASCASLLPAIAIADEAGGYDEITGKDLRILRKAPAISVAGYRVAFVVSNNTFAHSIGGNAFSRTIVTLSGVDTPDLQQIADEAYADLMQRLAATGRPVVPPEQVTASKGWAKLEKVEPTGDEPYAKKAFADSRLIAVFAPAALPLWWMHLDAPLGSAGPGDLANWRALNQLSVDTKSVVLTPQIVVDFAALESSGSSTLSGDASTEAKVSLRLVEQSTAVRLVQAKMAFAGEIGTAMLKKPLPLADSSGRLVNVEEWGNQSEVAFAKEMVMMNGGMSTAYDPGRSTAGQELAYVTDPAEFRTAVMDGIRRFNTMIAAAAAEVR